MIFMTMIFMTIALEKLRAEMYMLIGEEVNSEWGAEPLVLYESGGGGGRI